MEMLDWLVLFVGVTILSVATFVAFLAGKRKGIQLVSTDDKDSVSLRGLSLPAREKMKGYVKIVHVWDENRRPDKHKFKSVHYD